jgi:hypothetical protein
MSRRSSHSYQATTPPEGATCDSNGCGSAARVRMIIPESRFDADGIDHSNDPPTFGACDLHWPGIRDTCVHNGHDVVDTTGDIGQLAVDFPQWTIFRSDGGRLYASARLHGTPQGMTLDACLIGQLRAKMQAAVDSSQVAHHG